MRPGLLGRCALALGFLLMSGLAGSAGPQARAAQIGSFVWAGQGAEFGGFSALHLSPDGRQIIALSDHGAWITGQITRDAGVITAISAGPMVRLHDPSGTALPIRDRDSEGLTADGAGGYFVSFEGKTRIMRYDAAGMALETLPRAPEFATLARNNGLESLTRAPDGTLYTVPEQPGAADQPLAVYLFRGGVWQSGGTIARRGTFLPVDAAFGPDGRFYLLERQFLGLGGFASRLRRFQPGPDGLTDEVTLFQTDPGDHDNLEGLAIWRDATGLRATMISDNNFTILFRTELVEMRLPD